MNEGRRNDIDWLRIGATYLLFIFHAGKVFDPAPFFHIRSQELSFAFTILCGFIGLWHMPLFFLLAGWSALASLSRRGAGGFLRERLQRLAVPLVAGCVLMGPVMKYLELCSGLELNHRTLRAAPALQDGIRTILPRGLEEAPPFDESFLEFLPSFFTSLDRFTWGHLWFIAYLLALSAALLPLLSALLRRVELPQTPRPWMLYAPIVPLAIVQLTLRERWPGIQNLYDDWANVSYYGVYLAAGFVLASWPALEELASVHWKKSLTAATATTLLLLLGLLGALPSKTLMLAGPAVAGWCFVAGFVGLARIRLTHGGPALAYLAESAFPVYLLHQFAIIVIGYWLIRLPMGVAFNFVALVATSLAATLAVYHFCIRPFDLTRVLTGMKPRPRAQSWMQVRTPVRPPEAFRL